MAQNTLIVAVPKDATTLVPIEADSTEELFRIGCEMFPRHRWAAVNNQNAVEECPDRSAKCRWVLLGRGLVT
jgi:hypothetical protein